MLVNKQSYESESTYLATPLFAVFLNKISDYAQFAKLRLSLMVLFSAAAGYILGAPFVEFQSLFFLLIGGLCVTSASNGFNQIIERKSDALMTRTADRPLPAKRMTLKESVIVATVLAIAGLGILLLKINFTCFILGLFALLSYTLAYTPLKKKTPFAVFIGAIPGAVPPLLGWVAATGSLGFGGWILFFLQFIWQFPHFWAIAWVLDQDYRRAGFKMLPSAKGKDKVTAMQVLVYSSCLLPLGILPSLFSAAGIMASVLISIAGVFFLLQAISLYKRCGDVTASKVMYGSFVYLPIVYLLLILDKIL